MLAAIAKLLLADCLTFCQGVNVTTLLFDVFLVVAVSSFATVLANESLRGRHQYL
ncbi:hypothetical protein ACOBV8_14565 [Pseudoalteromonas espejiana]